MVLKNPLRPLLGLGFWVQGFRLFPWMAVNYFLKDTLHVDPSLLQVLLNSANLPMVGKPFYGIVSDAVYIGGQHRLPYIVIGGLLQAISWLTIAFLPHPYSSSIFTISLLLCLSNLGASIVEVANDALVAESSKHPSAGKSGSGELQSFAWMAGAVGGILGNLFSGIAISQVQPKTMFVLFALLVVFQVLITLTIKEKDLQLPSSSQSGIKKQMCDLTAALKKPEIASSIAWLFISLAFAPVLSGTMFFYQTHSLKLDASVVGFSKVTGQVALLTWSAVYNNRLKEIPTRKLITYVQAISGILLLSDVLFVNRIYSWFGVPDILYVVLVSGVLEVLFLLKLLPFTVLLGQLCPAGCEGSLMAFLMSEVALAMIISGYLGVALASWLGVTAHDFGGLPVAIMVQAFFTLIPVCWSSLIAEVKVKDEKKID